MKKLTLDERRIIKIEILKKVKEDVMDILKNNGIEENRIEKTASTVNIWTNLTLDSEL